MRTPTITRRKFLQVTAGVAATATVAACAQPKATSVPAVATTASTEKATALSVPKYKEAPMLAELVKAGKLPPVDQRLPPQPLVVEPRVKVGKYGGTIRCAGLAPDTTNDMQIAMCTDLFRCSNDLVETYPNLAESHAFSNEDKTLTIKLREGIKWSDGHPMTADDMMFYFEDWQFNKDLMPSVQAAYQPGGTPMKVTKIDNYTVQLDFAIPFPAYVHLHQPSPWYQPLRPKHFMQKYHVKYNPDADAQAKAAGFDNWKVLFNKMVKYGYGVQDVALPVLDPWVPVKVDSKGATYERNPYYWKIDPEGNQLPYVDQVSVQYVTDQEVGNLKVVSGELTLAGLDLLVANYPILKKSEQTGNYRVVQAKSEQSANVAFAFNQNHPDPVLRKIFNDVRFRQATSVGINRQEINELVFLDQAVPRQANIAENASFYKKEWGEAYAQFDTALANKLLDEIGLDKRGADGIRLRPDGKPIAFMLEYLPQEGPKKEVCELVTRYWAALGLKVEAMGREMSYLNSRVMAGEQDATGWHCDGVLERAIYGYAWQAVKLGPGGNSMLRYCKAWQDWLLTQGKSGVEPPSEVKQLAQDWEKWQQTRMGTAEYREAGTKVFDQVASNLWIIGTVGHAKVPLVLRNGLENVLTEEEISGKKTIWWGSANWFWLPWQAEQWFLAA